MNEFGVGTRVGAQRRAKSAQQGLSSIAQLGLLVAVALPAIGAFTAWGISSDESISGVAQASLQTPSVGSNAQAFGFGTAGRTTRVVRVASDVAELGRRVARGAAKCAGDACPPGSGMCFVAGTEVMTDAGPVAIEDVALGSAVQTISTGAQDSGFVGADWMKIEIEADGTTIALLRPRSFVSEHGLTAGSSFDLALTEMGVAGVAQVRSIIEAQAPSVDSGFAVTGLYTRSADDVYTLTLGGQSIEPTGKHRFFSTDRNDWVATKDLRVGERLRTEDGDVTLTSIERKPGVHQVYNLEVAHEHTYLVSPLRLYTHNQYTVINTRVKPTKIDASFDNVRELRARVGQLTNPETPIEELLTAAQREEALNSGFTQERFADYAQGRVSRPSFNGAVQQAASEIFGESSGTELFVAGLQDIRNSIGDERFMEAMVKANSGSDYDTKLVTSLAYIARGDASRAKKLIAEAEQLSPSGQDGIYRGLLRRLEVLADVFDDGVEEVPADVINKYFRNQAGPVQNPLAREAVGIGAVPDDETLRILDRFDGRRSRYRIARAGDEFNDNTPEGTFLASEFVTEFQAFREGLAQAASERAVDLVEAVRNRELESALDILREIVANPESFTQVDSLARGQTIERLEDSINAVTLRFRPRDEPFTRRATSPEFDLSASNSYSSQPRPVRRLADQLARDIGVVNTNRRVFEARGGVRTEDLGDLMSEAFRATIQGDVDGVAPRLQRFEALLTDSSREASKDLLRRLRKDLEEYADLYRRGERRSAPPDLDPVDDRFRQRGAGLAQELSGASSPSAGN